MTVRNGGRPTATTVSSRLQTHEAVCAERYAEIKETLRQIQSFLTRATLSLIAGLFIAMGAILFQLAKSKGIF